MLSALSAKAQAGDMIVIDKLACEEYKTKTVVNMLAAVGRFQEGPDRERRCGRQVRQERRQRARR